MNRQIQKANYGFDAPSVMYGLLAGGSAGVALGLLAQWLFGGWLYWVGAAAVAIAAVFLLLGLSMVIYGLTGKHRMRDYMVGLIPWRGDEQVLDIGTGRGLMLIAAAKKLRGIGRATGIDIWRAEDLSDNSLYRLAENVAVEGVENQVVFLTEDARKLSFADASMDIVFSVYCIHNIEDKNEQKQALLEIIRVLKPGGRALIAEWMPVASYARIFKESGMIVRSNGNHIGVGLTLMWMVDIEKPQLK